jgi:hypothetical protein
VILLVSLGQALAILKVINCPFYFIQAFGVLKRLIPNPFEFAASFMNVDIHDAVHILNLTYHIHDVGRALLFSL